MKMAQAVAVFENIHIFAGVQGNFKCKFYRSSGKEASMHNFPSKVAQKFRTASMFLEEL